ncbi:BsaWI family type II restriction enzyme [Helicobacter pylori]|uniref:BsaWI family type II restriction enzyme n=1 Tax=Helicobacter pylori TaxID=210 RepID=UPI001F305DED|nr:BsaWI family type II restriction enzyme [Helicobacter pylori]
MYQLNSQESKNISKISKTDYMQSILLRINSFIQKNPSETKRAFDEIHSIIVDSNDDVKALLDQRYKKGEIKDISQALKSIAGSAFSNAIVYTFLKNKEVGAIREDVFITSKPSQVPNFEKISTINIGDETQKPDCDLVIYSLNDKKELKKCVILSLKTSLRERAGQTYKWKLLMEIATSNNSIKEKYNITYSPTVIPLVCFATISFYNEINNPQQRGMFKFFDKAFIGKNLQNKGDFIAYLSELVDYANSEL